MGDFHQRQEAMTLAEYRQLEKDGKLDDHPIHWHPKHSRAYTNTIEPTTYTEATT